MSESIAEARIIENRFIELRFLKEDINLGKEEVINGWKEANALDPEKKLPVLLITANWSLPENEAFKPILSEIKSRPLVAIVVHNLSQRLIGNFTLNLIGKSGNIKIFDKEAEARIWMLKKTEINNRTM